MSICDLLISDFYDPRFQCAFRLYLDELDVRLKNWEGLFREMNESGENRAYLRVTGTGETVGFLQFIPITFSSWFFEEKAGFIREFWVAPRFRGQGHGSALLELTENWCRGNGLCKTILTSDTTPDIYLKKGYRPATGCTAKNKMPVFVKELW